MAAELPGVGIDLLDDLDARCPGCGAALQAAAPWCTQCYRELRPPDAVPVAGPPVPVQPVAPGSTPDAGPTGGATAAPTWPCTSCGADNALDAGACSACGLAFLSDLRTGEPPLLVLPVVGDVAALGRTQRLVLATVVVAVLLVLALVAGRLLP